jgi:hypothetical protein
MYVRCNVIQCAQTQQMYSKLLLQWEKREQSGHDMHIRADTAIAALPFKLPKHISISMLHLDDGY